MQEIRHAKTLLVNLKQLMFIDVKHSPSIATVYF